MVYNESLKNEAKSRYASGMSFRGIAALPGMPSRMTVWRWVNNAHDGPGVKPRVQKKEPSMDLPQIVGDGPTYPDIDPQDKDALIERLKLENEILRAVNEVLKGGSLRSLTNQEKTLVIEYLRQTTAHALKELTDFLKISKSSYEYQRNALMQEDKYAEEFHAEGDVRGYRVVNWRLRHRSEPILYPRKLYGASCVKRAYM